MLKSGSVTVSGEAIYDEYGLRKNFDENEMQDRELIFEFYNDEGKLLKWEAIMILTSKEVIDLPEIKMALSIDDLNKARNIRVKFDLEKGSVFQLDKEFKYIFSHHIGWEPGDHRVKEINPENPKILVSDSFTIPAECIVLNIGAGIDIKFGKFTKRIYNQKLVYRGDWALLEVVVHTQS